MESLTGKWADFVRAHRDDDVRRLALQLSKSGDKAVETVLRQIAGYQVARHKVPSWSQVDEVNYPPHLSLEQCSSEITARYKASLVGGARLADLTGGMGVDCYFMAQQFEVADYIECQPLLCELAQHNFDVLGARHINVHQASAIEYILNMPLVDWIYLDPARRDKDGGKVVALSDCMPDVSQLEDLLLSKSRYTMVKLSPMLDLSVLQSSLKHIAEIHIVSVANECKEILVILTSSADSSNPQIICVDLWEQRPAEVFRFTRAEESVAVPEYTDTVDTYLYEPSASILKAGAFRSVAARYGLTKLHRHSHLYTSNRCVAFPGRTFEVESVSGFSKRDLAVLLKGVEKANLTVRNFPASAVELRKRLKLKDGGDVYLFATTMGEDCKVLIKTRKVIR